VRRAELTGLCSDLSLTLERVKWGRHQSKASCGGQVRTSVLDVGCGAGLFCALAGKRGATVSGLDAAEGLLDVPRRRTPSGDFREGEMEELPFADGTFDVVTGFNSFHYAADPVNALRQARRVSKPSAKVAMAVWGLAKDCQSAAVVKAMGILLPASAWSVWSICVVGAWRTGGHVVEGRIESWKARGRRHSVRLYDRGRSLPWLCVLGTRRARCRSCARRKIAGSTPVGHRSVQDDVEGCIWTTNPPSLSPKLRKA
jgi:SAM-dependent methyltransferase